MKTQLYVKVINYNIVRSMTNKSETMFSTKMCIETFYIYPYISNKTDASYDISSEYVIGENCAYIHQTSYAYCGESNLNECRNCQRQGCTVIECGNDPSYEVIYTNIGR
jgi:hypothetical protein